MVLRHVDVDHRLVDPLVAEPRLQPPRVHTEQRGVGSEGVAQVWNNRAGSPARRQILWIALSAWSSVFAEPSRFRTTQPSRMTLIRLSASCSLIVIEIVRRVRPLGVVVCLFRG